MLAYFADKLKNTPDGDGNLLDHSLVLYGSPMGDGNVHGHRRVPLVLLGPRQRRAQGQPARAREGQDAASQHAADASLQKLGRRGADRSATARARSRSDAGERAMVDSRSLLVGCCLRARWAAPACALARRQSAGRRGDAGRRRARCGRCSAQKADVNAAQGDGSTALHWAVYNGDAELVRLLLAAGADVKAKTRLGGADAGDDGGAGSGDAPVAQVAARRQGRRGHRPMPTAPRR